MMIGRFPDAGGPTTRVGSRAVGSTADCPEPGLRSRTNQSWPRPPRGM